VSDERPDPEDLGDGFPEFADSERRPSRLGRSTLTLVGAGIGALVIGTFLYYSDRNSDHFELRCGRGQVAARQGLYFPWGTGSIDEEAHAPLLMPSSMSCAGASYASISELDTAFAALLLEAAEHRLTEGGPAALAHAREDVERATRLQGLTEEQRSRTEALLADMVYHEGREILRQVERDLWQARRKLERARDLGAGRRIGDLDEWIEFVETETERFRPALAGGRADEETPREGAAPDAGPPPGPASPAPEASDTFL